MRLFVAINFSNDIRAKLSALCDELRATSVRGSFSAPENLHLTLAFLGECDSEQADYAIAALDLVDLEPFEIVFDRVGRFRRSGEELWWVGPRESKPLLSLQSDLCVKLAAVGFTLERRKFSPHITLGRRVVTNVKPYTIKPFGETVRAIDLMKSERINGKLTYTRVHI